MDAQRTLDLFKFTHQAFRFSQSLMRGTGDRKIVPDEERGEDDFVLSRRKTAKYPSLKIRYGAMPCCKRSDIDSYQCQRGRKAASDPGRAETSGTAHGLGHFADFGHAHLRHRRNHHLGNPHAAGDDEIVLAEIDQQHLHFAAIVAVDRAGRIEAGDTVLEGKSGAWADLRLEARRYFEDEAGRHQRPFSWSKRQWLCVRHGGTKIHAGSTSGFIGGQVQSIAIFQADEIELGRRRCVSVHPFISPLVAAGVKHELKLIH